ncbi:hypothetical protein B0H12DRAFT_1142235 [Mycena haematopus]|nr:hypothetical protein B0H12DRAFT_1142235 [Mycena haematopus]
MFLATFCDLRVSAVFDVNAAGSSVSLDWVLNSGIRSQNSRASGVLSLQSVAGVVSVSMNDIPVAVSLPSDLVLGLDWLQFVSGFKPGLVVQLSSGPLELRWPPLPAITDPSSSSAGSLFPAPMSQASPSCPGV